MNNSKHRNTFNRAIELVIKDEVIKSHLLHIALLGSARCNENIENYSDLDILFIFRTNITGTIAIEILERLKKINSELSIDNNIEISFLPHTIFDFKEYVDFEYLIHYSWGEVAYGNEDSYKKIFEEIIKEKYSVQKRKDLIYYNLIHARFNLFRKYISWNENNKKDYNQSILKLFIDNMVEICDWALIYKNIFERSKKDIANKFIEEYFDLTHKDIIIKTLEIRSGWNKKILNEKEINLFFKDSILLIEEIIKNIYGKHKK